MKTESISFSFISYKYFLADFSLFPQDLFNRKICVRKKPSIGSDQQYKFISSIKIYDFHFLKKSLNIIYRKFHQFYEMNSNIFRTRNSLTFNCFLPFEKYVHSVDWRISIWFSVKFFSFIWFFRNFLMIFALGNNKKTSRQKNFPIKRENRHLINQTKVRWIICEFN